MRRLLLAAALLMTASRAGAYPGSTAANFLKIGVGARPVSMGQAYTAVADDANAMYYNPAGLSVLERQEVALMHDRFFDGVDEEWGAYAFPSVSLGTFGGAFSMLHVAPFNAYTADDVPNGTVSATDMAGALGWGFDVPRLRGLSAGASLKLLHSQLAAYTATAEAVDAGLLWRDDPNTGWSLGISMRNLGTKMRFVSEAFQLPLEGHVGVAYRGSAAPLWNNALWLLTLEGVGSRDRAPYMQAGFEFRPVEEFGVRAGYDQGQDTGTGISAGVGFRSLERGFVGDYWPEISLDYAFVDYGILNQTHRISVTFRFGVPKPQRREGVEREPTPFQQLLRY